MSYQQMISGGILWIEQRAYIDGRDEIGIRDGLIAAKDAEIKSLRGIAGSVSILAGKIEVVDERLRQAQERREKPLLQIGWYNSPSRRFCYTDEKEHNPTTRADYTVPVYAIYP